MSFIFIIQILGNWKLTTIYRSPSGPPSKVYDKWGHESARKIDFDISSSSPSVNCTGGGVKSAKFGIDFDPVAFESL